MNVIDGVVPGENTLKYDCTPPINAPFGYVAGNVTATLLELFHAEIGSDMTPIGVVLSPFANVMLLVVFPVPQSGVNTTTLFTAKFDAANKPADVNVRVVPPDTVPGESVVNALTATLDENDVPPAVENV